MTRPHYDDLDDKTQGEIGHAVVNFLRDGGHRSLAEAMETLGMESQKLWSMTMTDAGLPDCVLPQMIQVGWKQ